MRKGTSDARVRVATEKRRKVMNDRAIYCGADGSLTLWPGWHCSKILQFPVASVARPTLAAVQSGTRAGSAIGKAMLFTVSWKLNDARWGMIIWGNFFISTYLVLSKKDVAERYNRKYKISEIICFLNNNIKRIFIIKYIYIYNVERYCSL